MTATGIVMPRIRARFGPGEAGVMVPPFTAIVEELICMPPMELPVCSAEVRVSYWEVA